MIKRFLKDNPDLHMTYVSLTSPLFFDQGPISFYGEGWFRTGLITRQFSPEDIYKYLVFECRKLRGEDCMISANRPPPADFEVAEYWNYFCESVWRGMQLRRKWCREAIIRWRTVSRTFRVKAELMAASCAPNRLAQIGID